MSDPRPAIAVGQIRNRAEGQRIKPPLASLRALPDYAAAVIDCMVHGLDNDQHIDGKLIEAGTPLTLKQAALACSVRTRQARELASTELFAKALNKAVSDRRNAERPRNLATAIEIRDDPGDGSAATKTVRLKAIDSIEGKSSSGNTVNVNVQQNNVAPGYVIRLGKRTEGFPND
ncbi:MAG: hypothetical protein WDN46_12175 [Methylocella sp.]